MRRAIAALAILGLAGCGARPVAVDSLTGPNPVMRTRNYVTPELQDLKNRGHTYLAGIKETQAAVQWLCARNGLKIDRNADWSYGGAGMVVTGRSAVPAGPVKQTLALLGRNFPEYRLTKGRYWLEIGITSPVDRDKTNVVMREYFEPYDELSRTWLEQFTPPGLITKDLFKQLDKRMRVLKNPSETMWRNW